MSKIDREQFFNSPATIGVKKVGEFIGDMSSLFFEPAFWFLATDKAITKNDKHGIVAWQVVRTLGSVGISVASKAAIDRAGGGINLDALGIIYTLSYACTAGAVVDWVGVGLEAIGNKSKKNDLTESI